MVSGVVSGPEDQPFEGPTLDEALARCLISLVAPELTIGP
jgi:hypothetical protein